MEELSIKPLSAETIADFQKIHCMRNGMEWCQCVAWWCPTWKEITAREAEENKQLCEQYQLEEDSLA